MKSSSIKLSKLELLLSLSIVAFIGGPIGYRVYQICNVVPGESGIETSVVRMAYSKTDGLILKELVAVEEDVNVEQPQAIMDFSNRQFTRINLSDFQILSQDHNETFTNITDAEMKPVYSFKENILLFSGVDASLKRNRN